MPAGDSRGRRRGEVSLVISKFEVIWAGLARSLQCEITLASFLVEEASIHRKEDHVESDGALSCKGSRSVALR